ncbi:hypothetical protein BDW22DRAFT_1353983 [Trametopsis cervina]|nr:hypothetical protein BDW22DRAFT_1353983 [Trametopsis cervina]
MTTQCLSRPLEDVPADTATSPSSRLHSNRGLAETNATCEQINIVRWVGRAIMRVLEVGVSESRYVTAADGGGSSEQERGGLLVGYKSAPWPEGKLSSVAKSGCEMSLACQESLHPPLEPGWPHAYIDQEPCRHPPYKLEHVFQLQRKISSKHKRELVSCA